MPLDPSIIGGGKPPDIQTPNPLDLISGAWKLQDVQAQVEQRRLAADKARQQAADQADVQRAMAAAGGDVETALPQLYATNPRAAAGFEETVGKARKEKLEAAGKSLDNQGKQADLALQIGRTVGDDGAGYGLARPAMVATSPALDQILPPADAPWDPARWSQIMQAGVSGKEQIEQKQKVLELFADGKFHAALGNVLSQPDITPAKWDQAIQGAVAMGMPRAVADEFGGVGGFSPANVANAARLAIPAATRVTEAGQAATRAQTAARDAQTATHQGVEESQAAARLRLEAARLALEKDAQGGALTLTPEALALTAHQYAMTGQLPPMGMGKAGATVRTAIINQAADTYKNLDLPTQIAAYKANQSSLTKLQGTADKVSAFENTAGKNLDQFLTLANQIPDTGIPWLNQPVRTVNQALVGSANQAAFNAARDVALREIARVTNDPNLSGALSDSARQEVSALSPQTATFAQIKAVAKVLKQDMANVHTGLRTQITDIQQRIATPPGTTPSADQKSKADPLGIR